MDIHKLRKEIDTLIYAVETGQKELYSNEEHIRTLAMVKTKLQEAKMWAGKVLEATGSELPEEHRDHCNHRAMALSDNSTSTE